MQTIPVRSAEFFFPREDSFFYEKRVICKVLRHIEILEVFLKLQEVLESQKIV